MLSINETLCYINNWFFINVQARGWSLWWPQVVKLFLWKTVTMSRLYNFSLLSAISFFTFSLQQMFWKRDPCLEKNIQERLLFFHTLLKIHYILTDINFINLIPLRSTKAGRFEKLLCFARSQSVVARGSVNLSCPTSPHLSCFSKS